MGFFLPTLYILFANMSLALDDVTKILNYAKNKTNAKATGEMIVHPYSTILIKCLITLPVIKDSQFNLDSVLLFAMKGTVATALQLSYSQG